MTVLKKGFTLIEVNLAIFIMATGVLAMVSLYSLGMRESRQSTEDVAVAGYADAVFAPLVAKLSATNLTWQGWTSIGSEPQGEGSKVCDGITQSGKGWADYIQKVGSDASGLYRVDSGCTAKAKQAFQEIAGAQTKGSPSLSITWPSALPSEYFYGLVATRKGATISLAFRASRRRDALMSQPVYYTDVRYQGRDDE